MERGRKRIGSWEETLAAQYLAAHGYAVLRRNLRTPHGEVDILACREGAPVFVEVKTRTTSGFGPPELAVTARKPAHMLAATEAYLQAHPEAGETWQFDVIAVEGKPGAPAHPTHFENVIA